MDVIKGNYAKMSVVVASSGYVLSLVEGGQHLCKLNLNHLHLRKADVARKGSEVALPVHWYTDHKALVLLHLD